LKKRSSGLSQRLLGPPTTMYVPLGFKTRLHANKEGFPTHQETGRNVAHFCNTFRPVRICPLPRGPCNAVSAALEPPREIVEWQAAPPVPGATYQAGPRSVVVLIAGIGVRDDH
jgi:hypothetical protein